MKLKGLKLKPQDIMNLLITTQLLLKKITEWNGNIAEPSGEDPSNFATKGHWNTGPHREYVEQGDEDGWS